ncbi:MAG: ACT domain-containing protein [Lachnospiraceae bacterium]
MTVKQISVFLENRPGQMAEFTSLLSKHHIDMRALSIAETKDFGIVRVIVDDPYQTACVLKDNDYICSITPVLAVEIADKPGSLNHLLDLLGENQINIEYTYAFITRKHDTAYMVFRVEDNEKAIDILTKNGIRPICQDQLYEL